MLTSKLVPSFVKMPSSVGQCQAAVADSTSAKNDPTQVAVPTFSLDQMHEIENDRHDLCQHRNSETTSSEIFNPIINNAENSDNLYQNQHESNVEKNDHNNVEIETEVKPTSNLEPHRALESIMPTSPSRVWRLVRSAMLQKLKCIKRSWVQLAGHKDCFMEGPQPGTILKRLSPQEEECFKLLCKDQLATFVPQIRGKVIDKDGQAFLEMQDLLTCFKNASVMDVKMGCRTYREEELKLATKDTRLRSDMYEKMIEVDISEPTAEENEARAVTKPRYMIWRETISSSANLGFRIEAMRLSDGSVAKDFKTVKTEDQVMAAIRRFTADKPNTINHYRCRLRDIREALVKSEFFLTHELIGSSLLFVHDEDAANIWLIDFAKTYNLPKDIRVTHSDEWQIGNHEDGYLTGIDNLISLLDKLHNQAAPNSNEALSSSLPKTENYNCSD